eukprot:3132552-Rhodomonas_salina.2
MPINYFKKNWIETHNPETGEDLKENRAVVKATKENPVVVEDIANFWDFKWSLCITNAEVLSEKQLEAMADPNMLPYAKLTNADLLQCCQKGWMAAFDETNCLLGWQKVRLRPFTRSVFWELKRSQVKAVDVRQHATLQTGLNFDFLQMKAI